MGKAIKKIISRHWPLLVIVIIWIVFAHPYIFNGLVPFPSRYLVDFFSPWNNLYAMPVKNAAMPDVISQLYPWKTISIDSWRLGEIPKWNPYQFAGNPHMANYQSAVFSPVNLLFLVLPFLDAWSISVLLQPLLAGLFMYIFTRSISISKAGSLLSSISFMFCGFMTVWMAYGTLGYAILFLPLILWTVTKYFQKPSIYLGVVILFATSFSFFSGHFQTSLYLSISIILYVLFKTVMSKNARNGLFCLTFIVSGIILSLPQILATFRLFSLSVRSSYFEGVGGIPWQYLITTIAPDFFGNPVTRNDWFGYYAEWMAFVGGVALTLALISIVSFKKNSYIKYFSIVALLTLLFIIQSSILEQVSNLNIPLISTISASRVIVLVSFSIAVLSGFGIDSVRRIWVEKNHSKSLLIIISTILIAIVIVWILLISNIVLFVPIDNPDAVSIAMKNFLLPTGIVVLTLSIVIIGKYLPSRFKLLLPVALVILLALDMLRFSIKWMPFDEREYVYPSTEALEFLQENAEYERVYQNLSGEAVMQFKLYGIEGYDPVYISRYGELVRSSSDGSLVSAERSVVKVPNNGGYVNTLLDLLGVKYILHSRQDENASWVVQVWEDPERFNLVYQDDTYEIYENTKRFPRAFMVYDYEVINDEETIISKIYSDEIDLSNIVLLEKDIEIDVNSCQGESSAEIVSYTPNTVSLTVQSECPGILVLTDNYYPEWKVFINNKQADILRANYSLRAVVVPKGRSIVEFKI